MSYEAALACKTEIESLVKSTGAALAVYLRQENGLVLEAVRLSAEYRRDKYAAEQAFAALRSFNAKFMKVFGKEYKARRAERQAQGQYA